MRLSHLLATFPDLRAQLGAADPDITRVTADSRQVIPGALFVAVRGDITDGHRFIPQALANGAAAVIVDFGFSIADFQSAPQFNSLILRSSDPRLALGPLAAAWHNFPSRHLTLLGVTGTDGKTTTTNLIHSILLAAGLKAGMISTVSAVIGDESLDTGFHVTTPDAPEVQGYLARMVAAGLTHCVLETTSHGWAQGRLAGCDFDVAVITNITHEHLDYHKTYAAYRAAKAMLFQNLAVSAPKPGIIKTGVLNADDSSFDYLRSALSTRALTYAITSPADVRATAVRHAPDGLHFQSQISNPTPLRFGGKGLQFSISSFLVGDFNVSNCLAAIAATVGALGIAPEAAQRGIAQLRGVPGRMERIDLGQPFTAIVDFAHTPNALRRALETARTLARSAGEGGRRPGEGGRVIAVFGSAGLRDVEKRRLMAETSAALADVSILTAEDPRTESLADILEMMAFGARSQGAVEGQSFFRVPDRGEAIRLAVQLARPGDIVLACGKGHEQSMCFGTTEYPWDDRTALRWALADLLGVEGYVRPVLPTTKV